MRDEYTRAWASPRTVFRNSLTVQIGAAREWRDNKCIRCNCQSRDYSRDAQRGYIDTHCEMWARSLVGRDRKRGEAELGSRKSEPSKGNIVCSEEDLD